MAKASSSTSMRHPTVQRDAALATSTPSAPSVTLLVSAPPTRIAPLPSSTPAALVYNTAIEASTSNVGAASGTLAPSPAPVSIFGTPILPPSPPPGAPPIPPPGGPPLPHGLPGPQDPPQNNPVPPWVIAVMVITIVTILILSIVFAMWIWRRRRSGIPPYKAQLARTWDKEGTIPPSDTLTPLNARNSLLISHPQQLVKKSDRGKGGQRRPGTAESIGRRVAEGLASVGRSHAPAKLVISNPVPVPNITLEPPTPSSSVFTGLSTALSFDSSNLQALVTEAKRTTLRTIPLLTAPERPAKRVSVHVERVAVVDDAYEMVDLKSATPVNKAPPRIVATSADEEPALFNSRLSVLAPSIVLTSETGETSPKSEVWDGYEEYLDFANMGGPFTASPPRDTSEVKSRSNRWSESKSASSVYSESHTQGSPRSERLAPEATPQLQSSASSVFERATGWNEVSSDQSQEDEDLSDLSIGRPGMSASDSNDTNSSSVNLALWELVLGHGSISSLNDFAKKVDLRKSRLSEVSVLTPRTKSPVSLKSPASTIRHDPGTFTPVAVRDSPEREIISRSSCWSFLDDLEGDMLDEKNIVLESLSKIDEEDGPHVSPLRIAKRAIRGVSPVTIDSFGGRQAIVSFQTALTFDDETSVEVVAVPDLKDDSFSIDNDNSTVEDHLPSSPPGPDLMNDILAGLSSFDSFKEELIMQLHQNQPPVSKRLKPSRIPVRRLSKRRSVLSGTPSTPKQVYLRSAIPSPAYSSSARPRRAQMSAHARSHQKLDHATHKRNEKKKRRSSVHTGTQHTPSHSAMKAQVVGRRMSGVRGASVARASLVALNIPTAYAHPTLSPSPIFI